MNYDEKQGCSRVISKYLYSSTLIREWRIEKHHQNIHHCCRYILFQSLVGVVSIVCCYRHLTMKTMAFNTQLYIVHADYRQHYN